jgi:hypothetical protein
MPSKLLSFIGQTLGRKVQSAGGLGGQCVDLVELWMVDQGAARTFANAAQLLDVAPREQWSVTLNAPTNYPPPGAIVVWHQNQALGIPPEGHTSIALLADERQLLTLDQNWPDGSPVATVLHRNYAGVVGWMERRA